MRRHRTFSSRAIATAALSENSHAKASKEKQQRYLQAQYTSTHVGRQTRVLKNGERERVEAASLLQGRATGVAVLRVDGLGTAATLHRWEQPSHRTSE